MTSDPKFIFGNSYAIFFGESSESVFHQNVAFKIFLGASNDIHVVDEHNNEFSGRVVLIKLDLINLVGDANIHILRNSDQLPIKATATRDEIIATLDKFDQLSFEKLDPRLLAVLDYLNQNLDNPSILDAAKHSGLSRSRIRTLAREQIGVPLSTWVMWRKLVKANKALSRGENLTDSALAGHFSDQAHFTRIMKRMFGVTPTQASRIYT